MKRKINRAWRVVMIVLVVLVAFRLSLPFILTRYVNGVIGDLGPYSGRIKDVNVHFLRMAYDLVEVRIQEKNEAIKPIFDAPLIELSIEWNSLWEGAFVGEAIFVKPTLNFYAANSVNHDTSHHRLGKIEMLRVLDQLMPVPLNHLQVNAGKINFTDSAHSPAVVMALNFVQIDAQNLQNVKESPEDLPSRIYLQALSSGNGQLNIAAKANVELDIPAIDMDVRFEKVDLKGLQPLFTAYGEAVIQEGDFNLYAEIMIDNAQMTGYVKPIFQNVSIRKTAETGDLGNEHAIQMLVARIAAVLKTRFPDRLITSASMNAKLPNENSQFWPAVWSTFSNAFTSSFGENTVNTVALATAPATGQQNAVEEEPEKSKKELRRERRKEKRDERKRAKEDRKSPVENAKGETKKKDNS